MWGRKRRWKQKKRRTEREEEKETFCRQCKPAQRQGKAARRGSDLANPQGVCPIESHPWESHWKTRYLSVWFLQLPLLLFLPLPFPPWIDELLQHVCLQGKNSDHVHHLPDSHFVMCCYSFRYHSKPWKMLVHILLLSPSDRRWILLSFRPCRPMLLLFLRIRSWATNLLHLIIIDPYNGSSSIASSRILSLLSLLTAAATTFNLLVLLTTSL